MSQVFIHHHKDLTDLLQGRCKEIPVVVCNHYNPLEDYPDLIAILHHRQITLYQDSLNAPLYLGLLSDTFTPTYDLLTHTAWVLQQIKTTLPIEFKTLSKNEVVRLMFTAFLTTVSKHYHLDLTDCLLSERGTFDKVLLFDVVVSAETVVKRSMHLPRRNKGQLAICVSFQAL